jgi:hypothetical protein
MKTAFWQASLTASQDGESSRTNGLEHTLESSILTDLRHSTASPTLHLRFGMVRSGRNALKQNSPLRCFPRGSHNDHGIMTMVGNV